MQRPAAQLPGGACASLATSQRLHARTSPFPSAPPAAAAAKFVVELVEEVAQGTPRGPYRVAGTGFAPVSAPLVQWSLKLWDVACRELPCISHSGAPARLPSLWHAEHQSFRGGSRRRARRRPVRRHLACPRALRLRRRLGRLDSADSLQRCHHRPLPFVSAVRRLQHAAPLDAWKLGCKCQRHFRSGQALQRCYAARPQVQGAWRGVRERSGRRAGQLL